jgi:hypothetical protein
MKRVAIVIALLFIGSSSVLAAAKDVEIQGKRLVSNQPSFSFTLPSELQWVYGSTTEHPSESSLTRAVFFIREKMKQVEEMLIIQFAQRTNPQAGPMMVPPLKPYDEKRVYAKGKMKKGDVEVEYLTQSMAWNPDAPSLQPLVKKGVMIPSHWALQYQFLFQPQLEQAILVRYSKDVGSFGLKVSNEEKNWDKAAITGNEKKVFEAFQKMASEMVDSLRYHSP